MGGSGYLKRHLCKDDTSRLEDAHCYIIVWGLKLLGLQKALTSCFYHVAYSTAGRVLPCATCIENCRQASFSCQDDNAQISRAMH